MQALLKFPLLCIGDPGIIISLIFKTRNQKLKDFMQGILVSTRNSSQMCLCLPAAVEAEPRPCWTLWAHPSSDTAVRALLLCWALPCSCTATAGALVGGLGGCVPLLWVPSLGLSPVGQQQAVRVKSNPLGLNMAFPKVEAIPCSQFAKCTFQGHLFLAC